MTKLAIELTPSQEAPGFARQAIADWNDRLPPELLDNVSLLVSELVTNSVRHAGLGEGGWIRLSVNVSSSRIRVEVEDGGAGFDPEIPPPSIYGESGWGLYLVGELSDRWGAVREPVAQVWFEIDVVEGHRGRDLLGQATSS